MNYTDNFQLNQWDAQGAIKRTDFNADNAKLDAALHRVEQTAANDLAVYQTATDAKLNELSVEKMYLGSYTGDGAASRTVPLPFAPRFAIIFGHYNNTGTGVLQPAIYLVTPYTIHSISFTGSIATASPNFFVSEANICIGNSNFCNASGQVVYYVLFR